MLFILPSVPVLMGDPSVIRSLQNILPFVKEIIFAG